METLQQSSSPGPTKHTVFGYLAFLTISVATLVVSEITVSVPVRLGIAAVLLLPGWYLFQSNRRLFVPALFFLIHAVLSPVVFLFFDAFSTFIPQMYFFPSILVYAVVLLYADTLRSEIGWFVSGQIDRKTAIIMLVGTVIGALLVVWGIRSAGDGSGLGRWIPDAPMALLLFYGLMFAATGAIFEEFLARAVLYDGFQALSKHSAIVIFGQALVFVAWRIAGGAGTVGEIVFLFFVGVYYGLLRWSSKGMFAPVFGHFVIDAINTSMVLILLRS